MKHNSRAWLAALLLGAPLVPLASGCVTAAVGAAGAAAGIAYTHRGAKSDVVGTLPDVNRRAAEVFQQMGITTTESKQTADKNKLVGKQGDMEVEVRMKATGHQYTQVEVTAHSSAVNYDKEYARNVMQKIISAA